MVVIPSGNVLEISCNRSICERWELRSCRRRESSLSDCPLYRDTWNGCYSWPSQTGRCSTLWRWWKRKCAFLQQCIAGTSFGKCTSVKNRTEYRKSEPGNSRNSLWCSFPLLDDRWGKIRETGSRCVWYVYDRNLLQKCSHWSESWPSTDIGRIDFFWSNSRRRPAYRRSLVWFSL